MCCLMWSVTRQYEPKTRTRLRYFGAFNESKPKTELEWHIYRGRSMPGPGSYTLDKGHKIPGGRFNEGHAKTSIEILQHYTRGEYMMAATCPDVGM